ncbi:hypothetical protein Pmani_006693 [Petrolisthes manimaculis]|uniref:Uncharacterized protein n=1 Tax=Petrolisthes manimaculis TaxID=1843537 RepID=A0AAE1Q9U8_9EUCA|nr:hypothetical protein Pmani_006693 [Petrolisthes manimaculis]
MSGNGLGSTSGRHKRKEKIGVSELPYGETCSLHVQPIDPPTHQPDSQTTNQSTHQPTNQTARLPTNEPTNQPTRQPDYQPINLPTHQPDYQPMNPLTNQPDSQTPRQSTKQFIRLPDVAGRLGNGTLAHDGTTLFLLFPSRFSPYPYHLTPSPSPLPPSLSHFDTLLMSIIVWSLPSYTNTPHHLITSHPSPLSSFSSHPVMPKPLPSQLILHTDAPSYPCCHPRLSPLKADTRVIAA